VVDEKREEYVPLLIENCEGAMHNLTYVHNPTHEGLPHIFGRLGDWWAAKNTNNLDVKVLVPQGYQKFVNLIYQGLHDAVAAVLGRPAASKKDTMAGRQAEIITTKLQRPEFIDMLQQCND
jgi:hypothetical protein